MSIEHDMQNGMNTLTLLGKAFNGPSREYTEAVELLELRADWITDRDGIEVQVVPVTVAADLICEHYERREP